MSHLKVSRQYVISILEQWIYVKIKNKINLHKYKHPGAFALKFLWIDYSICSAVIGRHFLSLKCFALLNPVNSKNNQKVLLRLTPQPAKQEVLHSIPASTMLFFNREDSFHVMQRLCLMFYSNLIFFCALFGVGFCSLLATCTGRIASCFLIPIKD